MLYAKFPSETDLQSIHFAVIGLMIIAAKVEEAMQNKLRNLLVESETVILSLSRGLLS